MRIYVNDVKVEGTVDELRELVFGSRPIVQQKRPRKLGRKPTGRLKWNKILREPTRQFLDSRLAERKSRGAVGYEMFQRARNYGIRMQKKKLRNRINHTLSVYGYPVKFKKVSGDSSRGVACEKN